MAEIYSVMYTLMEFENMHPEHEHEFIQPQQQQCRWLCAAQQLWLLN